MTDTDALRECPFCGATPHKGLTKVKHCQLHGEPYQDFQIWCPHGCARMERSKAKAIAAWNTRPAPEQSALVERLENLDTAYRNASNDAGHWHLKAIERKERIAELDAEIARLREDWNALFDALFDAVALIGHCMDMKTTALIGGETLTAREVWQRGHDLLLGKRARAALKETRDAE